MIPSKLFTWSITLIMPLVAIGFLISCISHTYRSQQPQSAPQEGRALFDFGKSFRFARTASAQSTSTDISVGQTVFPEGNLMPAQPIVYSLFITNNSPITLSGIIVSDIVPREMISTTIISTANGSTILQVGEYPTYTWQIDNVAASTRVAIYIIGRVAAELNEAATIDNVLRAAVADDTDQSNNISSLQSGLIVPQLSFEVDELSLTETPTQVNVTVLLEPANPYGPTLVDFGISPEFSASAMTSDPDFESVSGTISFEAAEQRANTISITLFDDNIDEDDEHIQLFLTNPRGASIVENHQLIITINDNDQAGVNTSTPLLSLAEGGTNVHYELTLNSQPTAPVIVEVQSYPQIVASPASITFTAQTWDIAQTVNVIALDDTIAEGVHNGIINHRVASIDTKYDAIDVSTITAGIVDNDQAAFETSTTMLTVTEGVTDVDATSIYSVSVKTRPTRIITVTIEVASPLVATPDSLRFTPENWEQQQLVTISAIDDSIITNAPARVIHHVRSDDPAYDGIVLKDIPLTYLDNDTPGINIMTTNPLTMSEGVETISYEIALTTEPEQPVTVELTTDAEQVTVQPNTVIFDDTNWDQLQPLTVTAVDDLQVEGTHSSYIEHNTQSDDPSYDHLAPANVMIRIVDNDVQLYLPYVYGD